MPNFILSRAHAHIDTKRREPWLFSEETRLIIREAIRKRYQLLPLWYTLFHEHSINGAPVMRPLWYEFTEEEAHFAEEKVRFDVNGVPYPRFSGLACRRRTTCPTCC